MSGTYVPVAICGYSCKLPQDATDAESLWRMCVEGRNAWSSIPHTRFSSQAFHHVNRGEQGTTVVTGGHFMADDIYNFDASFFNLSVENAMSMDPVLRLQLQSTFEAFEHAGLTLEKIAGTRVSVFSGSFHRDYHDALVRNPDQIPRYLLTGAGTAMLSNRISHFFDLTGPSTTIDTGCSSSLTALHMACRSLQAGDCDKAVVTGCNVMINPDPFISMSALGLLGPSGRSFAFEQRAEGYGRGEGVVTLLLKPLAQAEADGDLVHAVIRGSAINQDGKTATITSPSQKAQEDLIGQCYASAGLDVHETAFVECHGTGTKVGDLCEASAIHNAFSTVCRDKPLYIGSVKSNIGHLEAGSGLASIIKVIKSMDHSTIPPNSDVTELNSAIAWKEWNLEVPLSPQPWPTGFPKQVSVNSFGYGGANAHVILTKPPLPSPRSGNPMDRHMPTKSQSQENMPGSLLDGMVSDSKLDSVGTHLFLISANDQSSCDRILSRFQSYLKHIERMEDSTSEAKILSALAYRMAFQRSHFKWRVATTACSISGLIDNVAPAAIKATLSRTKPSLAFIYTGQGAQWAGMGKELVQAYPVFYQALTDLDQCLKELGGSWSIIDELSRDPAESRLHEAEYSMPICCALQIALTILLRSWGIQPSAVAGHSSGESAAAFACGALDMRSALGVQYYRGVLTARVTQKNGVEGGMLATALSPEEARMRIGNLTSGKVVIGCFNSPSSVTVSGDETAIIELEKSLKGEGLFARRLKVETAFHSHHMEADVHEYKELLQASLCAVQNSLDIPLASSVTGAWMTRAQDFGAEHWVKYMLQPVQFFQATKSLLTDDTIQGMARKRVDTIIEIGPHSALLSPLKQTMASLKVKNVAYTSLLERGKSAVQTSKMAAGFLWSQGHAIDIKAFIPEMHRNDLLSINIPSYAWSNTSLSLQRPSEVALRHRRYPKNVYIGTIIPTSNPKAPTWQKACSIRWYSSPHSFNVDDIPTVPQALFLTMASTAVRELASSLKPPLDHADLSVVLEKIRFSSGPSIRHQVSDVSLQTTLTNTRRSDDSQVGFLWIFQIHAIHGENQWDLLCEGEVRLVPIPDDVSLSTPGSAQCTVSPNHGVRIRQGLLDDILVHLGLSKSSVTSMSVDMFPDHVLVGLEGHGTWTNVEDVARSGPQIEYSWLVSVFHSLGISHCITAGMEAPLAAAYIERVVLHHASRSRSFYVSKVRIDNTGDVSVVMDSKQDDINQIGLPPSRSLEVSGVRYEASSSVVNQAHEITLHHSLINIRHENVNWIPKHVLGDEERRVLLELNLMCTGFFCETLKALRKTPPRRLLGHWATYVKFMKSVEENSATEWQRLSMADKVALKARVSSSSVNGKLICTVGDQLVSLIRGEGDPLQVMMHDRLLYRYYEEGLRWTRSYEQLHTVIKALSIEYPRMDVLEIGAGTGGATTSVLKALEAGQTSAQDLRCATYTYTDISAGFFAKAKEKFGRYAHAMKFQKLNAERDLKSQGFEGQAFDLIIASQCLHATSNMRQTMKNVRKLLRPCGRLVLLETTKDSLDIQLFASCFSGWWLSEEPERKWSPSLSQGLWEAVLRDSGFSGIDYTVRDCEDESLYAMQVLVSTAIFELDQPLDDELRVVTAEKARGSLIADVIQRQVGNLCRIRPTHLGDLEQIDSGAFFLMYGMNNWTPNEIEKMFTTISSCKGVLVVTTKHPGQETHRNSAHGLLQSLRMSFPQQYIVSFVVDAEQDLFAESTILALASLLKTTPEKQDRDYYFRNGCLEVLRPLPIPVDGLLAARSSLKPNERYVVRGRPSELVDVSVKLLSSFGAQNVQVITDVSSDWVGLAQDFAGIIDFAGIQNEISTAPKSVPNFSNHTFDFNFRFVPLPQVSHAQVIANEVNTVTVYMGPIATSDEPGSNTNQSSTHAVEIPTLMSVLSDLFSLQPPFTSRILAVGLPQSLPHSTHATLIADPRFRSLAPRPLAVTPQDTRSAQDSDSASGPPSPMQLLASMSLPDKTEAMARAFQSYIADMFMLAEADVDVAGSLAQYIDSLTAVQLKSWIRTAVGVDVSVEEIADLGSILLLAGLVAEKWKPGA